jgi:hypothetical protein
MGVVHGATLLVTGLVVAFVGSPAAPRLAAREAARQSVLGTAEPTSSGALRHFSADLAIRHWRVTPAGVSLRAARPAVVMRVVREHRGGGWVTTLNMERVPDALIDAPEGRTGLSNPFRIARVEFGDDDSEARLFDRNGRPVSAIGPDDLRMVGAVASARRAGRGPGQAASAGGVFLAEAGHEAARRLELVRRFGPPAGRVGDLERYVSSSTDGHHEALVTVDTALPVDIVSSLTAGGRMRTTLAYEAHAGYGHVRRLMRTEHHLPQTDAGHAVTQVELSNVVLSGEVRP